MHNKKIIRIKEEHDQIIMDGEVIRMQTKPMNILIFLCNNIDRVFKRSDIIENVWHDSIVSQRSADIAIAKIRKSIEPDIIETITNRGYTFNHERYVVVYSEEEEKALLGIVGEDDDAPEVKIDKVVKMGDKELVVYMNGTKEWLAMERESFIEKYNIEP